MTSLHIPASSADLTVDWLNEALEGEVTQGATIVDLKREVIGEGAGFIGELTRITPTYSSHDADAPRSFIAKLPIADEAIRSIALLFGWYEHEIRFYQEIAGQIELRTPKCYYSAMDVPAGRFALLLEDLAPARCGDQLASCSLEEAKLALSELAKLHAAWWNSPRLEEFDWMPALDDGALQQVLVTLYQQSWPYFVEQVGQQVPEAILDVGERFGANFSTMMEGLAERPRTIMHTDFRLDNMFFGVEDGGSPFALIDWQLIQRGGGAFDVTYFLAGNFPPEVRRKHETELLHTYHDGLLRHGVSDYPFEQCVEDYRMAALFLLIFLVTNRENFDIEAYPERGQALLNTMLERYTTAIVDLTLASSYRPRARWYDESRYGTAYPVREDRGRREHRLLLAWRGPAARVRPRLDNPH